MESCSACSMQDFCYGIDGTTYLNSYWLMEKTFGCPCIVGIVKHLRVPPDLRKFLKKFISARLKPCFKGSKR